MVRLSYPRRARLADERQVQIHLDCYCHTCRYWHRPGPCTPDQFSVAVWDWHHKHEGHEVEFLSPRRRLPSRLREWWWQKLGRAPWWLTYRENTDFKLSYTAVTALTISLASVASNTTFTAGRNSTAIDNSSNRYMDYQLTAKVTTGTTPTIDREIRVYSYQALNADGTPAYPDTVTGSDAAVTLTSAYTLDGGFVFMGASSNSASSNVGYPIKCLSLAQAYGLAPKRWGVYVTHSTAVNLHSTGGNHFVNYVGAYLTDT